MSECECGFTDIKAMDWICCGCGRIIGEIDEPIENYDNIGKGVYEYNPHLALSLNDNEMDRCSTSSTSKCLITPLRSLSPTVIRSGGRGIIKACLTNGADLYLGALVTDYGEIGRDIDLAQDDEIITGVIIKPTNEPLDIDRDYDNPFPDNEWVNVYGSPDEAELWCCINKKYKAKRMFEVIGKSYNEVAGLMWSGKLADPEIDSLMHEGELSFT